MFVGEQERINIEFPCIRSMDNRPNKCIFTRISSWPPALAKFWLSFVMVVTASWYQEPKTSHGNGRKVIPSCAHAKPYFDHFCWYLVWRAEPGSAAALSTSPVWRLETTQTSKAACWPPAPSPSSYWVIFNSTFPKKLPAKAVITKTARALVPRCPHFLHVCR